MPNDLPSSALEKALVILDAISDQPQPIGLSDLVVRVSLPRATVHRVLRQLDELGLVIREPKRERFSVGPQMMRLAITALGSRNQGTQVKSILDRLVDDLGETCSVGVLDGADYVYLARSETKSPLRSHFSTGSRFPAHTTSGGKLLLAGLGPASVKQLYKGRRFVAYTPKTITRLSDLQAELAKVRAKGFAINNQGYLRGIVGVAVPIRHTDKQRAMAALTMQGPMARFSVKDCERHIPTLARAAARLARVWISD
jgi:DNA-binding IclR family transcriptional regulator